MEIGCSLIFWLLLGFFSLVFGLTMGKVLFKGLEVHSEIVNKQQKQLLDKR